MRSPWMQILIGVLAVLVVSASSLYVSLSPEDCALLTQPSVIAWGLAGYTAVVLVSILICVGLSKLRAKQPEPPGFEVMQSDRNALD